MLVKPVYQLTEEQKEALNKLMVFLSSPDETEFVIRGFAGTGKTHLLRVLCSRTNTNGMVFTAPTNKATKVLRKLLEGHTAVCKTIYSLTGIRMTQQDDHVVLTYPDQFQTPSLSSYQCVFVDEGSMVNEELVDYLRKTYPVVKFCYIGDPAQLPPVGEERSKIWEILNRATLTEVVRHDNQILALATHVRSCIYNEEIPLDLRSNHDDNQGVWKYRRDTWISKIEEASNDGLFTSIDNTKVIAWRNKTVEHLNSIVRRTLYGSNYSDYPLVGDRVMIAEPVMMDTTIVATVDDEGTIRSIQNPDTECTVILLVSK